jgi:hypothetical protein
MSVLLLRPAQIGGLARCVCSDRTVSPVRGLSGTINLLVPWTKRFRKREGTRASLYAGVVSLFLLVPAGFWRSVVVSASQTINQLFLLLSNVFT